MRKKRPDMRYRACGILAAGADYPKVAEETGYSISYIRYLASKAGIKCAKRTISDYHYEIMEMLGQGVSRIKIAERLGYSPATITNYLKSVAGGSRRYAIGDEEETELEYSTLTFTERRPVNITKIYAAGKCWQDVTEIYIPR